MPDNAKLRLFLLVPLLAVLLVVAGSNISWAGKLQTRQTIIDIAPSENEKTELSKNNFGDKESKDGNIRLSKKTPNEDKDSCFPILYGEKESITLDFQNANIRNLFRIISEFSGFNVIFSPEVAGSVNIRLYDMPWNQALEIILVNSDLGRECFGNNVVRIANRKTLEAELAEKEAGKPGPGLEDKDSCFPALYGKKEKVSLDFQNANLSNLFRVISEVSGFNLILSPGVGGLVNIRMLDVPWNHALEIILKNSSLGRECFVKGTVRIANTENLNKASKITGAEKGSAPRLFGKELNDVPPVAMAIYEKIQNEYPELLGKMNHYEGVFNNSELLQEMSDEDYKQAIENYKDILEGAGEIKMTKTLLQNDYQSIRLTGVISIKKEKVAMFETSEKKGFSVRKGDRIGPDFGYVDDIQLEQVVVIEKARNYLGKTIIKKHVIALYYEN